jgi:hypothetical protein
MQRSSARTGDRPRSAEFRELRCARSLPRPACPAPSPWALLTQTSRTRRPSRSREAAVTCLNSCSWWPTRVSHAGSATSWCRSSRWPPRRWSPAPGPTSRSASGPPTPRRPCSPRCRFAAICAPGSSSCPTSRPSDESCRPATATAWTLCWEPGSTPGCRPSNSSWTARRSAAPGPAMGERCTCWPPCSPDPAP